jgi:hypothetical protein
MRAWKIISIILVALVAATAFVPAVDADTVEELKGTVTVPGNSYKVIAKVQTANATSQTPTYVGFYINETKDTTISFKVLLLDEDNYNNYTAGQAYSAYKQYDSHILFGIMMALGFETFSQEKLYYLVVDNQAHSESLKVDYAVNVGNGDLIPVEDILWTIWIIVIAILIVAVIIVLYIVSKKKTTPPMPPPLPPQPPQQPPVQ